MSHLYELGLTVPAAATGTAFLTIAAGAASQAEVRQVTVSQLSGSTRIEPGLGRPAAPGTGTITGTALQPGDPDDSAANTLLVLAGGFGTTQPTVPAVFLRDYMEAAVVGGTGIWTWEPGELVLAPSGQLVLWQVFASTGVCDVYVRVAE